MATIKEWELWYADFPFDDNVTISKRRPVIVLQTLPLVVMSIKVTSAPPRVYNPFDVPITEWKAAGLATPSCARISKTANLPPNNFKRYIGILHENDIETISATYAEFMAKKRKKQQKNSDKSS